MSNMPRGGKGRLAPTHDKKQMTNIKRAMKRLTAIIRANFGYDNDREAHITFTYRGAMKDHERLYSDFKRWYDQLRYHYPDHNFDYVAIMEPHGSGGWHIHLLLKSTEILWRIRGNSTTGLDFEKTIGMWRKANGTGAGAVRHERLPDNVSDYGKYFAAYFTTVVPLDVELSGDREAVKQASKAAVKGSRVHYYPAGFKFYRCSQGIERPKLCREPYESVLNDYGPPKYINAYTIKADEGAIQLIQSTSFDNR